MESAVVPAVSVPSSYICLRSLHRRGIGTIVASERDSAAVFRSNYADETARLPHPERSETDYRDALLELSKREDVRTIVPFREEDVFVLARYADAFEDHVDAPLPDFETLRRVQDRVELFDAAEAAGVPVPETHLLTDHDDWSQRWVIKGRYSILTDAYLEPAAENPPRVSADGGVDGGLVKPPTTQFLEPGEQPDVDSVCADAGHVPLVQEYMPDTDEYGFFAIYDRGEKVVSYQHRQVRGFHYSGGPSAYRESVDIPELADEGTKLLDHLGWHGPAMVEFKRDPETGEFKLMEINPRFWSSLPFGVRIGADFPHFYWLLATGRGDSIEPGYRVGVGGHLLWGELLYLHSVFRDDENLVERPSRTGAIARVVASLVREPRFDYPDPSDPVPFLAYLYNKFKHSARDKARAFR